MKKIFYTSLLVLFVIIPYVLEAQIAGSAGATSGTNGTCTGEIRTDLAAAEDCVNKAIAQGEALGYDMSCKVEQLGLAGFVDPTSGKDYILNGVCTVNGSTGHGAYLLAGFTAAPGSNAIIQSVNPGWNILKTELAYESAFNQCGGKAPYYVNGAYTCTVPPGALPVPVPVGGSTKTTESTSGSAIASKVHQEIFTSITKMVQNLLNNYDNYIKTTLGFTTSNTAGSSGVSSTNTQCYSFTRTLQNGDSGADVSALTYALKQAGLLSQTTSIFDTTVMTAVKRFQELHSTEILNILGLAQGTGVVAERTRSYLNTQCLVPAYIASNTSSHSVAPTIPPTPTNPSCPAPIRSGIKNGKYVYMFKQNTNNTWTVTLNNLAYSTQSDLYYVPAFVSFTATDALDLNRQNQGKFNYLQALPGTAAGNTEYANLFGSFNNAYYDWNEMTKNATCSGSTSASPVSISSINPNSGILGSTVTLSGTGFTATGNKIQFGSLGSENNPQYSVSSTDGKTLTFIVPGSNYYSCWSSQPACQIPISLTQPGTYSVTVINANGTSNSIPFSVN